MSNKLQMEPFKDKNMYYLKGLVYKYSVILLLKNKIGQTLVELASNIYSFYFQQPFLEQ